MKKLGLIGLLLALVGAPAAMAQTNCTPKLGHPPLARKGDADRGDQSHGRADSVHR